MGIFARRRLCLFCFLFAVCALLAWLLPKTVWLCLGIVGAAAMVLLCVLFSLRHEGSRRWLTAILCLACVCGALLHTWVRIDLPRERAEQYVGDRTVTAQILDVEYTSEYQTQYTVSLLRIDGKDTHIRGTLICEFSTDLQVGDRICATGFLDSNEKDGDGGWLRMRLETPEGASVQRTSKLGWWDTLVSDSGLLILSHRARQSVHQRLSDLLGEEIGALASAFLLGDRSALSADVERDFRRAGASHMMAVSGLHVSVLLGSIELLLRRLFLPKRLRCLAVALCGAIFLFLTGFSLSACRSVLMLFCVYLFFFFQEGNDALTALFFSVTLILLVSPLAVADLGMWMSALATLGLLTVYPLCESRIPRSHRKGIVGRLLRWLRRCAMVLIMTTVATLFLLPVIWFYFGELSLISLPANLLLSPVAYLFLLGIPLLLIASAIPILGGALGPLLAGVGQGILWLLRSFARLPMATVSLNYTFCGVLIPLFTVAMAVLLVVRLKHKRWLLLPPALLILSFAVCLAVVRCGDSGAVLQYQVNDGRNEMVILTDGDQMAICDASSGSRSSYLEAWECYRDSTATELQSLLLTHYHEAHESGLDLLMRRTVVRTLYLPTPRNEESYVVARKLCELAEAMGTRVVFYRSGQTLALTDSVSVQAQWQIRENGHGEACLHFLGRSSAVTYWSAGWHADPAWSEAPDCLILGSHGTVPRERPALSFEGTRLPDTVIYSHRSLPPYRELWREDAKVYAPRQDQRDFTVRLPLS